MESQPINLQTIQSQIGELSSFLTSFNRNSVVDSSESEKLIQECAQAIEINVKQIVSEHSHVGAFKDEDLDVYMNRLKDELRDTEAESASLSNEIVNLGKLKVEGTLELERNLELLHHFGEYAEMKGLSEAVVPEPVVDIAKFGEDQPEARASHDEYLKVMKLKYQIDMNEMTLKSFQDLDLNLKRIEAVQTIGEALTGLKVIDFKENTIRVSLKTYIPDVEDMYQLNNEDNIKQSEVNHELLIELMDGTTEVKNAEIFPNDVYIGEIVEAANTFRFCFPISGDGAAKLFQQEKGGGYRSKIKLFSVSTVPQRRSSLCWFLQKVQDRILICTVRRLMVKIANKSRHSFEYLDNDELIVVHMAGGIDAFIKPSQGWPLSTFPLKLVSFQNSDQNAKEFSWSLLSKVEELANSFDLSNRKSLTNFVDGIEEILLEKIRPESPL